MRNIRFAVLTIGIIAAPLAAQQAGSAAPVRWSQQSSLSGGWIDPFPAAPRGPGDRRSCLVRKATGKTECRTLDEWRDLARTIARAQDTPSH